MNKLSRIILFLLALMTFSQVALANSTPSNRFNYGPAQGNVNATADLKLFKTTKNDCSVDVTASLKTFIETNGGAIMPPGCYLLDGLNPNSNLILVEQIPGTVTYKYNAGDWAIYYDPGSYAESNVWGNLQVVTAISDYTKINRDDSLQCLSVASTSGYAIGDYVHIMDAGGLPSQMSSPKTISAITLGATTTIDFTTAHGFSSSNVVYFYGVGGTTELNKKGWNLTVVDSDTITIQTMDGTTTGSAVNSTGWGAFTSGGTAAVSNGWAGEGNRVANVDAVQNRICLTHKLQYRGLYNTRPELHRYTKARKVIIQGGKFMANGDIYDPSITVRKPAITIFGSVEPVIRGVTFEKTWGQAVEFRGAPAFLYENNIIRQMPNQATFDDDDGDGVAESPEYIMSSITSASQGVFTSSTSPSTFIDEDNVYIRSCAGGTWTSLNNKLYRVSDKSGSTFKLKDMNDNYVDTSGLGTYTANSCLISEADVQGLGYGVLAYGPSFAGVIRNVDAFESRHVVTSGGAVNVWSSRSWFSGQSTYVTVQNVVSHSAFGPVADLHEDNAAWFFQDISCFYAARGATGSSYSGMCGQFRGKNTSVNGWYQDGGSFGIRVTATEHEEDEVTTLDNIRIQNLRRNANDNTDVGIWLYDQSGLTNKRYVKVNDVRMQNVGKAFLVETNGRMTVSNAYITDADVVIDAEDGSETTFDTLTADYRYQTRTADSNQVALMRSSVTYGGAKVGIDRLTLHRGTTTSMPSNVFNESDTSATKYYWLGDLIDDNYSGLTGTFSIVSSNTTIQTWTAFGRSQFFPPKEITNSTYTVLRSDSGKNIVANRSSVQTLTLAKTMPAGWKVKVTRIGAGSTTWTAESGATVNNLGGVSSINSQYGTAFIEVVSNADGQSAVFTVQVLPATREYCVALSDSVTPLTAGTGKANLYLPMAATVNSVRAYALTAPSGLLTVDINEAGTTLMSTNKLTIDANEKTSGTAATAAALTDTAIAADAEITFDIDGTTGGAGLVGCINVSY